MATAEEMIFSFVFFWTLISPRHSAGTLLPISRCFQAVAFAETFINTRPGEGTRRKQAFSRPAGQFPWPQHTLSVLTGTWWWRPTKGARKPRDSLHCFLDLISGHETRTGTGIRRLTEHLFTGTCRGSLRGWQRRKELGPLSQGKMGPDKGPSPVSGAQGSVGAVSTPVTSRMLEKAQSFSLKIPPCEGMHSQSCPQEATV